MKDRFTYQALARASSLACRTELLSSFTSLEEFGRLHGVIDSNRLHKSHWERNLCKYAHRAEPLFIMFTSIEALRWTLFVRNINARGWEQHLRDPEIEAI